jgi:predicted Zn-dependent protease
MGSTKAAGQHPYQFEVYVTTETMMNAYTSGGGIIFVTQGLVEKVPNEAQMAAVLSHEMAHVIKSHTAQRRSTNMLTKIGLTAAETYSPTTLTSQAAQMGSSVAANASLNVYNRSQELEADDYGVAMLIESNYEPGEMVRVFELFERENGTQPEMTSFFFNSHPSDDERIKKMRALLKEQAPTLAGRKFIKDTPEYQALTRSSRKVASAQ